MRVQVSSEVNKFAGLVGYLITVPGQRFKKMEINHSKNSAWIFDSGATDTMTFEPLDIRSMTQPQKSQIHTANNGAMQVKGGGVIEISPTMKLSNCLYDIRTGVIIGRGTERQGLYYVDEVAHQGTVMLAHGTDNRDAWLWHRRLGHPSHGYSHLLFPKLFPSNGKIDCETCLRAKSHRHPFKPSNTKVASPFSLIHSDVWGPAPVIGGRVFGTLYYSWMIALA
ncbi:putative RNA-directed DNA polymerase [Helianthus annuus]|nr:putative RNA-directed DNA polymerase [Helianthus annuus]KAJ0858442.1 putative RNA-directed DNA polymerase [Helianthus annuus]